MPRSGPVKEGDPPMTLPRQCLLTPRAPLKGRVRQLGACALLAALLWPAAVSAQDAAEGGDSGLRQRVEQLEGQLVDLQVVIGTLESLARTGGGSGPAPVRSEASGGMAASDSVRLDSMETQIRALTMQVEQLANELRQSQLQRRSDAASPPGFGETQTFGSTTVTSAENADPIGALAADPNTQFAPQPQAPVSPSTYGAEVLPPPGGGGALPPQGSRGALPPPGGDGAFPPQGGSGQQMAAADPMGGSNPKQLYETAYGYLLQQDYAAAQAGFSDFLRGHAKDPLAPSALYWLGETHYVQRNYADAVEAFDLVVSAYGSSGKAADAQLKHGMSLAQLGKQKEACTSLGGLARKFPNAAPQIKARADSERQRIGCQ